MSESLLTSVKTKQAEHETRRCLDARVVFLVNFLAPNHIAVCQALAERLRSFSVLCSVAMEGNRDWHPDWQDLDVRVQKTWTLTRKVDHPGGYQDVNYIHIPRDTFSQLRSLRPDAIVSLELGARTVLAGTYRKFAKRCAMVTSVYASERSEAGRGPVRRALRRRLLCDADWITYNGPSCQKYLLGLNANPQRMSPWDYAADPSKPYSGPIDAATSELNHDRTRSNEKSSVRVLTVGQLSQRKGVLPAAAQLGQWACRNPSISVDWHLLGSGPQEGELRSVEHADNVTIHLHGHCDPDQIRDAYRQNDVLLFPTLTDEWGLVVDESLHSGLPVIGSVHSQAATTLIEPGVNGFLFNPDQEDHTCPDSLSAALDQWFWGTASLEGALDRRPRAVEGHLRMRQAARESACHRTPQRSADQLVEAIENAMRVRFGRQSTPAAKHRPGIDE